MREVFSISLRVNVGFPLFVMLALKRLLPLVRLLASEITEIELPQIALPHNT